MKSFYRSNRPAMLTLGFCSASLLLLVITFNRGAQRLGNQYMVERSTWDFAHFVSEDYMPKQRRATKKWPTNLRGLSRQVQDRDSNQGYDLKEMNETRKTRSIRLRMLKSERYKCTYRLYYKDRVLECDSEVSTVSSIKDGGSCQQVDIR